MSDYFSGYYAQPNATDAALRMLSGHPLAFGHRGAPAYTIGTPGAVQGAHPGAPALASAAAAPPAVYAAPPVPMVAQPGRVMPWRGRPGLQGVA